MRLACSNIAWAAEDESEALATLRAHGVSGIEVAPTCLWPGWTGASVLQARSRRRAWADQGWQVSSMQALLFDRPDALLFGPDGSRMFEQHLMRVAGLGMALGAQVAVLGAPRQRQRGSLPQDRAWSMAIPVLRRLAAAYHDAGMRLAIEPARPEYGGDFIVTTCEAIDFVRAVDHPGLGVHLDAAAMASACEPIDMVWSKARSGELVHYQLSQPNLAGFEEPLPSQLSNLQFLVRAQWSGWCAVEMRRQAQGLDRAGPWQLWLQALSGHPDP
jgi:sugar phosphate isomerase/epimerase